MDDHYDDGSNDHGHNHKSHTSLIQEVYKAKEHLITFYCVTYCIEFELFK